jgi:ketosteroid isomerase-like protein
MAISQTVLSAMQKTNDVFSAEVVAKRDAKRLDRVYTADARVLPPGAPMMEGREQVIAFWQQAISALDIKSVKLTTVDAEQVGDRVLEIGRAELRVGSGNTVTVKYVVEWKQEGGDWKWHLDIWNMNE